MCHAATCVTELLEGSLGLLTCTRVRAVSVPGWEGLKQDLREAEWVAAVSGEELTGPSSSATMADSVPHVILIRRPV